jgi:hypothetical protein
MGGHYGSIHVRIDDATKVQVALEDLARDSKTKFLLAPPLDGWVTLFPSDNGQDFSIAGKLAEKISAPILHCLVHDDDVFAYQFHDRGKLVGTYNSCPDYFGGEPEPRGGDVDLLQSILPDPSRRKELKQLLDSKRFDFEMERLEKFSLLVGLPNAVSAYEYLQAGERDGIKSWKQFIHVPDLTAERNSKRSAKAKAKAEMKQLAKDGLLVLGMTGQKTSHSLFHTSPVWCVTKTNEVLLAWSGEPIGASSPTRVSYVNTQTGKVTPTEVEVSSHVQHMAVTSNGAWIAAGCACGEWKTQIWNLKDGKLVTEIPQSRAVAEVCFSLDDQKLFSLSEGTITVIDLTSIGATKTILLPDASRTMVLHPGGEYLVAECQGMLALVYLPTLTVLKTVWFPPPPGPERELMEYAASQAVGDQFLSSLEGRVSKDEFKNAQARIKRHFLPKQNVFCLSFGTLGNYLFCGTGSGLCVLAWDKLLAATDMTSIEPQAFIPAESDVRDDGTPGQKLIYAVPVDSIGKRALFAGVEGKIKFVNFQDGRIGDLLAPLERRPFWRLELTPDRKALVGTAVHLTIRGKKDPSKFQIWNYPMLCQKSGLDF